MKSFFTLALLVPTLAGAACFGSGSMYTCNDASGNTYNVQRYGNTTQVQGYNGQTGNSWSQSSTTMGNTTITNGTAGNGNSWNSTTTTMPGMSTTYGTDSRGNTFSRTCNAYGCN